MPKRLIICSDGTWNKPEGGPVTNVVKLARSIRPEDPEWTSQVVFYDWGVGTGGGADKIKGGAFGKGIDRNIQDAYRFLVHNYAAGDELFFFGFSRGAYTVRSLVGLIRCCGLLKKIHSHRIPDAYAIYRSPDTPDSSKARRFRGRCSREVKVKFLGVWDTVGALGIPLKPFGKRNAEKYGFHDTKISSIVLNAYHALAIDEKRGPFQPTIWKTKKGRKNSAQVWFAGVHSDVGGGYPDAGLSDKALLWMVEKAEACGLALNRAYLGRILDEDSRETLHNSMTGFYKGMRKYPRPIGVTNRDESVHDSAIERYRSKSGYRPENLTDYLEE
jgi:uncharacterized protein (DUF2235 family)